MVPRPRHTKRDANHADVKWGCEMAGLWVTDISDLPGTLDLIVADLHKMLMIEVKPDKSAPFTPDEQRILTDNPHTTMVAYSPEDVLKRFGRI